MNRVISTLGDAAAPYGLNLVAAIPCDRYDGEAPSNFQAHPIDTTARSIMVLGNGGGTFWQAFSRHADLHPGWRRRENPLDDFTREVVDHRLVTAIRELGVSCTTVYPFASGRTLDFMKLAKLAGLAGPSIIGVVVNPVYGPWIALRAALLVDVELDEPGPAAGFDPCPSCSVRSCISACPAQAVTFPQGWNVPGCVSYRIASEPVCAPKCHARVACVLGPEHRYPDDELAYHQERALRAMRSYRQTNLSTPAKPR